MSKKPHIGSKKTIIVNITSGTLGIEFTGTGIAPGVAPHSIAHVGVTPGVTHVKVHYGLASNPNQELEKIIWPNIQNEDHFKTYFESDADTDVIVIVETSVLRPFLPKKKE
jgi:hypothetical protein